MCFNIYGANGNGRIGDVCNHTSNPCSLMFLVRIGFRKKTVLRRLISRSWICKSFLLSYDIHVHLIYCLKDGLIYHDRIRKSGKKTELIAGICLFY